MTLCTATTEQIALLFSCILICTKHHSLCWSSSSQQFGLHFPSIHNFVLFIIRKVEINRYEPLKSLTTSVFMAKQNVVSSLLCVFFFLRLPHWLLFTVDSSVDIFGPTFILCTTYLVLCIWMALGSTHSPSPSLPVRLLTSLIWGNTSSLSICDITASFYIQHPISKESSLRNKMCWRRGKRVHPARIP